MEFDFHLHSYYSDGRLSPKNLVWECKKVGLKIIALTDHEHVGGILEAVEAGKGLGIKVIPGIELSADHEGREQHLLGLAIDCQSSELEEFLREWAKTKLQQITAMIKKLQEAGFKVELKDALEQARGSITRAHLGYAVWGNPENLEILKDFEIKTISDFFERFLKKEAYVKRKIPSVKEAIALIKKTGGRAIWAHPFWNEQNYQYIEEKAAIFQKFGLDGIEVCYNSFFMDKAKALLLHQIAQDLSMFETGGSDFHSLLMDKFNKVADFKAFGLELNLPPEARII